MIYMRVITMWSLPMQGTCGIRFLRVIELPLHQNPAAKGCKEKQNKTKTQTEEHRCPSPRYSGMLVFFFLPSFCYSEKLKMR